MAIQLDSTHSNEIPKGGGIYFIKVGSYGYVGQTVDFNARLSSHIRNAYYGRDNNSAQQLYWKMRIHRLKDVSITIYPSSSDYGIPDFDEKFASFLEEWTPVGKRASQDKTSSIDDSIKLDFAEIYHILYHFIQRDCVLTNIEIGGQVAGWTSTAAPIKSILNKSGHAIKLITRQTPPAEAYQTFLRGALSSMDRAKITEQVYRDIFADNWKSILIKTYVPLIKETISSNAASTFEASIPADLLSWKEFVETKILKYITNNITAWVVKSLNKNGVKTTASVRETASTDISAFVRKEFLYPRRKLVKEMFTVLFQASGKSAQATMDLVDSSHLDFSALGDYVADVIKNLIVHVKDSFQLTHNAANIKHQKELIPIRTPVVWKSHLHRDASGASWLLNNLGISKGTQISENWLKYRSLLLFDYLMNKQEGPLNHKPQLEQRFSNTKKQFYVPYYNNKPESWLSTRIHRMYEQYAPGYSQDWFAFYRPMVSLWRTLTNKPAFKEIKFHKKPYWGYETDEKVLILYSVMENFINGASWNTLKYY